MIEVRVPVKLQWEGNGIWRCELAHLDLRGSLEEIIDRLKDYLTDAEKNLLTFEGLVKL
jgi:hypothetical protein